MLSVKPGEPKVRYLQNAEVAVRLVMLEPQDVLGLDIAVPTESRFVLAKVCWRVGEDPGRRIPLLVLFRNFDRISAYLFRGPMLVDLRQTRGNAMTDLGHPHRSLATRFRDWLRIVFPKILQIAICSWEQEAEVFAMSVCCQQLNEVRVCSVVKLLQSVDFAVEVILLRREQLLDGKAGLAPLDDS
ncbi:hypothetical protein CTA2_10430 [Colletotrichum tanaceti]|uniref:Uncharacterized protein n=1 Tax=Colletotrichum tanaceti TaxID=1306861 RepID=A0A4U6XGF5_9PEZI|nr:hypothetical protein CTA2_10430 [Colletotrichum tanaceti]TKW54855.1 hypothetical protein CTA1_3957 [Colletotrichum tanaceti]